MHATQCGFVLNSGVEVITPFSYNRHSKCNNMLFLPLLHELKKG